MQSEQHTRIWNSETLAWDQQAPRPTKVMAISTTALIDGERIPGIRRIFLGRTIEIDAHYLLHHAVHQKLLDAIRNETKVQLKIVFGPADSSPFVLEQVTVKGGIEAGCDGPAMLWIRQSFDN